MKVAFSMLFCLHFLIINAQEESTDRTVRFNAGTCFLYLKHENVTSIMISFDFNRQQVPFSVYTTSNFHRDRNGNAQYDETNSQLGIGLTRFGIKTKTLFFDPFAYVIYDRRSLNLNASKYYGLGLNVGFKTGYRFHNFAIGLNINTSMSVGRLYVYDESSDKNQKASWGNHFFSPMPFLTLSWLL